MLYEVITLTCPPSKSANPSCIANTSVPINTKNITSPELTGLGRRAKAPPGLDDETQLPARWGSDGEV